MKRFNLKKLLSNLLTVSILCNYASVLGCSTITAYDGNDNNYDEFLNSVNIERNQTYSSPNNFDASLNQSFSFFSDDVTQEKNYVNYVAILEIFAWDGKKEKNGERGISTSGHAFIVITNNTYSYINAGGFPIEHATGITIGTWQELDEHEGLWYGLEGYKYDVGDDDFEGCCSMTMKLTFDQLKK